MSSSPLIEVVFEVRFKPTNNFATELLIAINQLFDNHLNIINAEGLHFPADLKSQQEDFYYVPSYKVNYESFSLLISDGSLVVLNNILDKQYEGWDEFKKTPLKILKILENKGKISDIHRFSLKYTNLIESEVALQDLNVSLQLGNNELDKNAKLLLKTEVIEDNFISLVEISTHVELQNKNDVTQVVKHLNGTAFIIDVINNKGIHDIANAEEEFLDELETLHQKANKLYEKIYKK